MGGTRQEGKRQRSREGRKWKRKIEGRGRGLEERGGKGSGK